jgi:hypothetical protein
MSHLDFINDLRSQPIRACACVHAGTRAGVCALSIRGTSPPMGCLFCVLVTHKFFKIFMTRIDIRPQLGPQTKFLSSPADVVIYGGGAGGGKT